MPSCSCYIIVMVAFFSDYQNQIIVFDYSKQTLSCYQAEINEQISKMH